MSTDNFTKYYLASIAFFFLLAMQYYQPNLGGHALELPINSLCWIAVSIIIAVGSWQWLKTGKLILHRVDFAALIVTVVLALPLLWSESPWRETVFDRYLAIVIFWFLVIAHRQFSLDSKQIQLLFGIIVLGIVVQCVIGIFQFFWADQIAAINHYRPHGTIQQVNVYASLIATGLGISLFQLLSFPLSMPLKFLHFIMLLLAGVLETLVQSRIGILGSILVFVALGALFAHSWRRLALYSLVISIGVCVAFLLQGLKQVDAREELASAGLRQIIYNVSWELIKQKPISGYGLGSFRSVYLDKQGDFYSENSDLIYDSTVSTALPHNEFLYWWIEGGVLPVIALLLFAFYLSIHVWRFGFLEHKASWLCTIPIILHTQTEYPLYHSVPGFALLAVLISQSLPDKQAVFRLHFSLLPKMLVFISPLVVSIYMLTNLHTSWLLHKYWVTGEHHYLFKTVNPFAQRPAVNYYKSTAYFMSGEPEALVLAEKTLSDDIKIRPTHVAYWTLYQVQLKMGKAVEAQKTYERGRYLYPTSRQFISQ